MILPTRAAATAAGSSWCFFFCVSGFSFCGGGRCRLVVAPVDGNEISLEGLEGQEAAVGGEDKAVGGQGKAVGGQGKAV